MNQRTIFQSVHLAAARGIIHPAGHGFQQADAGTGAGNARTARWNGLDGTSINSYTICTTAANKLTAELHDRMPVILKLDDYGIWLTDSKRVIGLLQLDPDDLLAAFPADKAVGNVKNDSPEFVNPL